MSVNIGTSVIVNGIEACIAKFSKDNKFVTVLANNGSFSRIPAKSIQLSEETFGWIEEYKSVIEIVSSPFNLNGMTFVTGEGFFKFAEEVTDVFQQINDAYESLKSRDMLDLWYGITYLAKSRTSDIRVLEKKDGGQYMTSSSSLFKADSVVLYPKIIDGYVEEYLVHELGHRFFFILMKQEDREEYDTEFGQEQSVSDYGNVSSEEDFAESFLHYVCHFKQIPPYHQARLTKYFNKYRQRIGKSLLQERRNLSSKKIRIRLKMRNSAS